MTFVDQKLLDLKTLWNKKANGNAMPSRAQFATQDLQPWFGNLALIDIPTSTIRLCGTNLIPRFGRDATGHPFDVLEKGPLDSLSSYIATAREAKRPLTGEYSAIIDGYWLRFRDLILPLTSDGDVVSIILFASYPIDNRPAWK
jgi:hypothetical protein